MSRAPATFRHSDVVRAVKAARNCGLSILRTEIGPDGKIVLVHGEADPQVNEVSELDLWRAKKNARPT